MVENEMYAGRASASAVRRRSRRRRGVFGGRAALIVLMMPLLGAWSWWRDDDSQATKEECLEMAMEEDKKHPHYDDPFSMLPEPDPFSDYAVKCERLLLRGCLLPPEPVGKVEEHQYRLRHCPKMKNCDSYAAQAGELQAQKQVLRGNILRTCHKPIEGLEDLPVPRGRECVYYLRQIEPVIDALAMLEISFQTGCFE